MNYISRSAITARLLSGLKRIENASLDSLKQANFVADVIRDIGLTYDSRSIYSSEQDFMIPIEQAGEIHSFGGLSVGSSGVWQDPTQLASLLVHLSSFKISSFIEIGTFSGWCSAVVASYLLRFNTSIAGVTVDPNRYSGELQELLAFLPLRFANGTSADFIGERFDLCLIDGDHSYAGIANDWNHVGRFANIAVFHDVIDRNCPDVGRFWRELATKFPEACTELLGTRGLDQFMGFGIIDLREFRPNDKTTYEFD